MRYVIDKTVKNVLIVEESSLISSGLSVPCYSKVYPIKKFYINDQTLIDEYVKFKINKKIIKLATEMSRILDEDDEDSGHAEVVLDGFEKLREILLREYMEYISKLEYDNLQEKIKIIMRDFEYNYNKMIEYNNSLKREISAQFDEIEMKL